MNNVLAGLMGVGVLVLLFCFGLLLKWFHGKFGGDGFIVVMLFSMIPLFVTLGIETWGRK